MAIKWKELGARWERLPSDMRIRLIELLHMEVTSSGGWIDPDLWDDDEAEAQSQVEMIESAIEVLVETLGAPERRELQMRIGEIE
jgi:hypothetical protein